MRLAPQHDKAVVSAQLLGFKRIVDLKNAADSSGKDDKRDRCRQRERFSLTSSREYFSVHMAMESGFRRRCEEDACTFELCAALSLAKPYQSNN